MKHFRTFDLRGVRESFGLRARPGCERCRLCRLVAFLAVLPACTIQPVRGDDTLPARVAQPSAEPAALFQASHSAVPAGGQAHRPGVLRSRRARVDLALDKVPDDGVTRWRLNLFDDAVFTARLSRRANRQGYTYSGALEGLAFSTVTLIRGAAGVQGVVRAGALGTYEIRSAGEETVLITQIETAVQCAHTALAPAASEGKAFASAPLLAGQLAPIEPFTHGCDDGTVIDIMVVYTDDARAAAGGAAAMQGNIALAVQEVNNVLANSQIDTELRLVHTHEVNYAETGDFQLDLDRLIDADDGLLDDVPLLRDLYGADCASFWSHYNHFGTGFFPDGSLQGINASGITLMDWRGYNGLLLAHELGHNLWCAHDRAHTLDTPYAEYAFGFVEPGQAWQDIMAQAPGVPWIPHFANPEIIWPGPVPPNPGPTGVAAGNPNPCDVALTIMNTRHIIANFRPTVFPGLPAVLYVNAAAAPGGDGLSWASAMEDLQAALCKASGSNGAVQAIWVAAGEYFPDRGTGNREAAFELRDGLALYGGFAGTETQLSQRDWKANPTVLSGAIGASGNDADNSFHVVKAVGNTATARLDGFHVTAGNADSTNFPDYRGGGLYCDQASPTIANCTFNANQAAENGGAIFNQASSPLIADCMFVSNTAGGGGGAIANDQSGPRLRGCTFLLNTAIRAGAMDHLGQSPAFIANCRFLGNAATGESGGAIGSFGASPTLVNCTFSGNTCNWYGGALYAFGAGSENLRVINCTFSGNTAGIYAGGVAVDQSGTTFINTIFRGNMAFLSVEEQQIIRFGNVGVNMSHCSVQGWSGAIGGTGNNGLDPLLLDDDGADDAPGTLDDNLRPSGGSPAVDTGDTAGLPQDTADLDTDENPTEVTPLDADAHPRVLAGVIDRGAYEFVSPIPADFDHDGDVDAADASHLAACATRSHVAQMNPACANAKLDADDDVDLRDFAIFQRCYSGPQQAAPPNCGQ